MDVPTHELVNNDTKDNCYSIKLQYVDAIERVFYHLRTALEEHNFLSEQMSQRLQIARIIPDPNENGSSEF